MRRDGRPILFLLFACSGFSGLIYESIWTHYLKLLLGHAAYAQTLVLMLFMGGMAAGAWLCSRLSSGWRNPLRGYAVVEAVIGIMALAFHEVFVAASAFAYDAMAGMGSAGAAHAVKWTLSALLILPQSVLLGMTFPLMTGGVIRKHADRQGETLAMLYFTNSLGGAAGVLVSGFVLAAWLGLPGTMAAAGGINLFVAVAVWMLAGNGAPALKPAVEAAQRATAGGGLLLVTAALTGTASFIYEVVWIRMLGMVVGASTHAFETMLAAFILGLALGGLWVRRRIDRLDDPVRLLAPIQVAMGVMAMATVAVYGQTFPVMQWLLGALPKDEVGYGLFNLATLGIAVAVMLPATFCAGMTLPLITLALIRRGTAEASIGRVYGANTVGGILGVLLAVHVGMPLLGLKTTILVGGLIDVGLGLVLWWRLAGWPRPARLAAPAALAVAGAMALLPLDQMRMASGVYRQGKLHADHTVVAHRDGKTATIHLTRAPEGSLIIRTNGKADAGVEAAPGALPGADEATMALLGVLPLLLNPEAKTAANIGFGSGITTHAMLTLPQLERVDTIEIEQAMVDVARGFSPWNERAFSDPRSRIQIEDAKTYFSGNRSRYDVIVSEPSNPWVSGVAGLFSQEFYALARRHLAPGGMLVQWMHAYEISPELVASVFKAIGSAFPHYAVYAANESDMMIVAGDRPFALPAALPQEPAFTALVQRIGVRSVRDLEIRLIGDRAGLEPFFETFAIRANSDYYPVLDQRAVRSRFLGEHAATLISLKSEPVPVLDLVRRHGPEPVAQPVTPAPLFPPSKPFVVAGLVRDRALGRPTVPSPYYGELLPQVRRVLEGCTTPPSHGDRVFVFFDLARTLGAFLPPDESEAVWRQLEAWPCVAALTAGERPWLALFRAIGRRDGKTMAEAAEALLAGGQPLTPVRQKYLVAAVMAGALQQGERARAAEAWRTWKPVLFPDGRIWPMFEFLSAHVAGDA